VPHWLIDAIVTSLVPIGVGLMGTMYRVGNTMGRIDERLKAQEQDIRDLQASWASSQTHYRPRNV
jgi:hypothetical protein